MVFFFNFTQFVIFENVSILDLALSGVNGLKQLDFCGAELE